jgi:hypothetical protein
MGVFDYLKNIFSGQAPGAANRRGWYENTVPVFTAFGKDIYLSDFVNNAIERVAAEVSKISVGSVVVRPGEIAKQNDDLTRLFRSHPNPLQTTSDFLASVEWLRRKNRNVFIYPKYEYVRTHSGALTKRYIALYPLNPSQIWIGEADGKVWEIKLEFGPGVSFTIPYSEILHLKWRRGKNLILGGGDDQGLTSDRDTLRTIEALDKVIQGMPKAIEASMQIKGVYHAKTILDKMALAEAKNDFEDHIMTSKTGIIGTDVAGDFTPMNLRVTEIPEGNLRFLRAVLTEKYGVSAAILSGDYDPEQHGAFYQTAIEDFIVQFEQECTAKLFSQREQDIGHMLKCYYSTVSYLSMENKKEIADLATSTGLLTLNEINEMFGMEPFAGGDRRLQSLNYVNVDLIDKYQIGQNQGGSNGE